VKDRSDQYDLLTSKKSRRKTYLADKGTLPLAVGRLGEDRGGLEVQTGKVAARRGLKTRKRSQD
jgi:hypothetical protein